MNVRMTRLLRWQGWFATLMGLALLAGCGNSQPPVVVAAPLPGVPVAPPITEAPSIKVLSNRADLISGGDALVEVLLPAGVSASGLRMALDGRDVTSAFAVRANGRYMGLLTGLAERANVLSARLPDGAGASLVITNHPNGGPVFSGAQVQPWPCLPGATDAQCNRPVRYQLLYRSTQQSAPCAQPDTPEGCGTYKTYDPENPPDDVAMTTTDQGKTVPYILRVETGTQDRGEYRIAVLYDPAKDWQPWAPQDGWNGKLLNVGGANCGMFHGESPAPDVLPFAYALSRGFLVWSTALSHNEVNCNLVTHSESLMMAKERIVENYGVPRYSIGQGNSGGSIKVQQAANAYPGLYDGINASSSFPDTWSIMQELHDCGLLQNYFTRPNTWAPGVVWSETQMAATNGHQSISVCAVWVQAFIGTLNPKPVGQVCNVSAADGYDAITHPEGIRCSLQDFMVGVLGRRSPAEWGEVEKKLGRGFANRPLDNVGVQYGLGALMAGQITTAQFIDLNRKVGGYDIDLVIQPQRMVADAGALAVSYAGGLVNQASNLTLPMLDLRGHDTQELHHTAYSYVMRARLEREHGHHDNHAIWLGPIPLYANYDPSNGSPQFEIQAFNVMDQWLSGIEGDTSALTLAEKIVKNKPAIANDRCTDASNRDLPKESCPVVYQVDASPRIVAGQPVSNDVVKCQLKPLARGDYGEVSFSDPEWAALQEIYPAGVCDYSKPGVEQQKTKPWMDYSAGPGGRVLPPPPLSQPLR